MNAPNFAKMSESAGSAPRRNALASFGSVGDVDRMEIPQLVDCNPGLEPMEYNVVVAPAIMAAKIGSIFMPDDAKDRMEMAMQIGRILAVSPIAFNYDHWPEGAEPPGVGDVVWFVKHGGGPFVGRDGKDYRLIKDKDIGAIIIRA